MVILMLSWTQNIDTLNAVIPCEVVIAIVNYSTHADFENSKCMVLCLMTCLIRSIHVIFTGAAYGNGSYFAVDPQYSASGYARPDTSGHKRMYLAKVLVGDYTQGAGGMVVPPAKNSGNSADLYDSVTDNTANPSMFIIFHDVQAYPEYIITFL